MSFLKPHWPQAQKTDSEKKYMYLALALTFLAIAYLAIFISNEYHTFHEYTDLAVIAYNVYFNVHYPQIARGFQILSFGQHLSIDQFLLVIPAFMLHESSITLLFVQLLVVYSSGFAIFFITRDLTKNSKLAAIFTAIFLIYPGTLGQVVYDMHIEYSLTLFYLLTFYFYAKARKTPFLISLALLLGSSEVAPIITIALGIGLLLYEYKYNKGCVLTQSKKSYSIAIITASLVAVLFYGYVTSVLGSEYVTPLYAQIPKLLYVNGPQNSLLGYVVTAIHNPLGLIKADISIYSSGYSAYLLYSLLLVFLGFGISLFFAFDVSILLILPWLSGVFVYRDPSFAIPISQNFGYVLSPVIVASILGIIVSKEKGNWLSTKLRRIGMEKEAVIPVAAVVFALLLSVVSPLIYLYAVSPSSGVHSVNAAGLAHLASLTSNKTAVQDYRELDSVIRAIPPNTSLMAEYFIAAHVIQRKLLEFPNPDNTLYFTPDYIIVDFNANVSLNACRSGFDNCSQVLSLVSNTPYTVYARNGTAVLYKRS